MFNGIRAIFINNRENINLYLINKSWKKIYKKILERDNIKKDLNNDIINKLIYIFF